MTHVSLSLGSNLGDRMSYIAAMERELYAVLADAKSSPIMETEPVGVPDSQPPYLNMIVAGRYCGSPHELLDVCRAIETSLGRVRGGVRRAARTADVDILLFGDMVMNVDELVIPHPEILNRRFCLEGLARIDAAIVIPGAGRGRTVGELCKDMCTDAAAQNVSYI